MSERDELRGTLSNTICNASNYTKRAQPYLLGSDMSVVLDKTADTVLAAGYRKPRTITTAEELDALGRGATVLDPSQDVWTNDGDTLDQWGSVTAAEPYGGPQWFGSADIPLPVTVLHDPEAKL